MVHIAQALEDVSQVSLYLTLFRTSAPAIQE